MTAAHAGRTCTKLRLDDDDSAEVARRYAEALINAAEKEGAVEPVLDELDRARARRPEAVPAVRPDPGLSTGFRRPRKTGSCSTLFDEPGLEPGLAVPAGAQSPRAARLLWLRSPGEARAIWDKRNMRGSRCRSARPFRSTRTSCKPCATGSPA